MAVKVSIIVPVYNVRNYVERCINSIISQSYNNLEIILIDDGSSDGSGALVDNYSKLDRRVMVIHQDNMGLSAARNTGLNNAHGDYVLFVDGDDWIETDSVRRLVDIIEQDKNIDIIEFGYKTTNGKDVFDVIKFDETTIVGCKNILDEFFYGNKITDIAPNKFYRKDLFGELRFDVGELHEDYRLMPKILSECKRVAIIDDVLYSYLKRDGSITQGKFCEKHLARIQASKFVIDYCSLSHGILKDYSNAARIRLCFACIYLYHKLRTDGMNLDYKTIIVNTFQNEYNVIKSSPDFHKLPFYKRCFLRLFNRNKTLAVVLYGKMRSGV